MSRATTSSSAVPSSSSSVGAQPQGEGLLPSHPAHPRQHPHRGTGQRYRRAARRAGRAHQAARLGIQRRARKREGPAAFHAPIETRAVAEEVHCPQSEADGHALRCDHRLQGTQAADQQPEQRRMRVAVGGEPGEHSHIQAPRPSRSRFSRTRTKEWTMSKWSTRTSSLRPVSKKTSSPRVNGSSALPNRERGRRADFATPRTLP